MASCRSTLTATSFIRWSPPEKPASTLPTFPGAIRWRYDSCPPARKIRADWSRASGAKSRTYCIWIRDGVYAERHGTAWVCGRLRSAKKSTRFTALCCRTGIWVWRGSRRRQRFFGQLCATFLPGTLAQCASRVIRGSASPVWSSTPAAFGTFDSKRGSIKSLTWGPPKPTRVRARK